MPPELAALAAGLLAKDPAARPASAAALAHRLEATTARYGREGAGPLARFLHAPDAYAASVPIAVPEPPADRPPDARPEAPPRGGRRVAAAALVGLFVLAVGYATLRPEPEAPSESAAARSAEALGEAEPPERILPLSAEAAPTDEVGEREGLETEQVVGLAREAPRTEVPAVAVGEEPAVLEPEPTASEPERAEPAAGTLAIVAEPWAEVSVDGEAVGVTPLGALAVPAGTRRVTFENPDFPPHTVEGVVASGGVARVAVSLWDLVGRVTLAVSPWARVSVDGEYWDTVPPQERPLILRPGTHHLAFAHPTLGTRELSLRVSAGEVRSVRVDLADGQQP